ncbi:hypothetical protein AB0E63_00805 [Kribbella sp. NPDC026596]|uniref:hypothetical protein n=1 Tax=Kribbella sp. NPDC026596 TaxID=3155122 RepID=UPI003409FB13
MLRHQGVEVAQALAGVEVGQDEIAELFAGGDETDQAWLLGFAGGSVAGRDMGVDGHLGHQFLAGDLEHVPHRAQYQLRDEVAVALVDLTRDAPSV